MDFIPLSTREQLSDGLLKLDAKKIIKTITENWNEATGASGLFSRLIRAFDNLNMGQNWEDSAVKLSWLIQLFSAFPFLDFIYTDMVCVCLGMHTPFSYSNRKQGGFYLFSLTPEVKYH